ncbi:hypothetical protein VTO42DRAFT_6894 [Malbranchea cinnamomea]
MQTGPLAIPPGVPTMNVGASQDCAIISFQCSQESSMDIAWFIPKDDILAKIREVMFLDPVSQEKRLTHSSSR